MICFVEYSIQRNLCLGMLSSMNMFFHIKGLKILAITFMIKVFFTEDQHVLSQPSQIILTPCDDAKNNSKNNCELDIEVPKDFGSYIDQNLNEDHDTTKF